MSTGRIAERLTLEFGDRALGAQIVGRLDQRALDALADVDPATTGLLSFSHIVQPRAGALVVFAFGNRMLADGALAPGPINLELARLADARSESTGLPVFAQWEVADEMASDVTRVGAVELADGSVEYLSTTGVAEQVRAATNVDRVAVLAMADHVVRCCRTLEGFGFSTGVPADVVLPSTYDPLSGQPWTRDRASYLAIDILARCLA